jgi:serine/threonine-protein kinase
VKPPDPSLTAALKDRYRIERELGAGGMATVYMAHDLRHDRPVALKVLRPELAAALGAERFLTEIRTTANLQHPHILGLIDSGEAGGQLFYVMPLVKGESLRARLEREKQLPVDEAVRITREVALALDYAHREGVIHRDIKPENILLQDGQAMVADFGIALAVAQAGAERLTQTGLSVGTPQYMSPEQAMGERQLTPRSDIYSLGCVLFELLAGEPPFTGPTAQAIIARAMISEPHAITTLRTAVPAHVGAAVHIALKKVAADRFATAQAFADALSGTSALVHPESRHARGDEGTSRRVTWKMAAVAFVLLAVGWTGNTLVSGRPATSQVSHLSHVLSEGTTLMSGPALSPNGTTIVYSAVTDITNPNSRRLYLKRLDGLDAEPLAGTNGASSPFFSPDGSTLGFFADGNLKMLSLADGGVVEIRTATGEATGYGHGPSWGDDGYLLFGREGDKPTVGIQRMPAGGGPIQVLSTPDNTKGELAHFAPQRLPATETVIYTVRGRTAQGETYRVVAQQLDAQTSQTIIEGASRARFIGGGRLMYQIGADVFVAKFDVRTFVRSGQTRVVSGVLGNIPIAWAVAGDVVVYIPAQETTSALVWVSREGAPEPTSAPNAAYNLPTISPNGDRVALRIVNDAGLSDVWIYDVHTWGRTRITSDGMSGRAIWTRDGVGLTYGRTNGAAADLYTQPADGSGNAELLFANGDQLYPSDWTRDGTLVVMSRGNLSTLSLMDRKALHPLVNTSANEWGGCLSPDEHWLAYFVVEGGRSELYVTPFPGGGPKWQISRDGAREAVWSRSGRELFFRNGKQMLVAAVHPGATFAWDPPRVLFEGDYVLGGGGPGNVDYAVSADDKRFLMFRPPVLGTPRLNIIQGWDRPSLEGAPKAR